MASLELQRLWKLHQIDRGIHEIRAKAAHLDVGKPIQAEIDRIQPKRDAAAAEAKSLHAEQTDLELAQKSIDDKLKKIDKTLYGGSTVSPREVENFEKEIASLKAKRGAMDERLLQLWEEVPVAREKLKGLDDELGAKELELQARRKIALAEKSKLEKEFADFAAKRPEASKIVPAALLARYEDVRKRHDGVGMAEVTRKLSCSACGTKLPERSVVALKEDRVVGCETCRRFLYYSEGVV